MRSTSDPLDRWWSAVHPGRRLASWGFPDGVVMSAAKCGNHDRACPKTDELRAFAVGQLPEQTSETIAKHIETCPDCLATLQELNDRDDPVLAELRTPVPAGLFAADERGRITAPPLPGAAGVAEHDGGAPPAGRVHVTLVPRTGGQPAGELQALLQRRLGIVALILCIGWGLTWTHKFFRLQLTPDTVWLMMVPGGLLLAFLMWLTAIFWLRRDWSLRRLRGYELVSFGVGTLFLLWENYFTIYRHGDTGDWMQRYVQRDLREMTTLARHPTIVWFMVIVGYGIFIPNTWRRCAAATGILVGAVLGMNLICGLWDETIPRPYLFSYMTEMATWLVMAAGYAIYGSHKISVLREAALEARKLGQYELKHRLGAGGMGEVYLAEHVLLKRPCALKLIRPERAGDPQQLRRFEREVRATAALTHPNTVEILDYGHADDGTFYYVMEYLPGLSLEDMVERSGPLSPERAVHLLRQVCGALREAHGVGLIHRDIKPGNVLVCERGGRHDVAKLVDFGLVQMHGWAQDEGKLTQEGILAGTPAYASPEQAAGTADLDSRSDLYSLGAVAYFLLLGQPPFVRQTAVQTLAAHINDAVIAPACHRPELPADLQAVVLRCLEKAPARRFQDADSLEQALAQCRCADRWTPEKAFAWWREHGEERRVMWPV
jgi:serine/threonine-protein kinase